MRPSHDFFMKWAHDVAKCSTCAKIQVGSVLVKDSRVLSIGYNGVSSGDKHCCEHWETHPYSLEAHAVFSEQNELHSEQNAILDALKRGVSVEGATLYTTHSPCFACAKVILSCGIKRVFYTHVYKKESIAFLETHGIDVVWYYTT